MTEALSGRDVRRIDDYIKCTDKIRKKYENPSRFFNKECFVDINTRIDKMIFHDSGRIKEYRDYDERLEENVDYIFETNVYHPDLQNYDRDLIPIVSMVKDYHGSLQPKNFTKTTDLVKNTKSIVQFIIKTVARYYGGLVSKDPHLDSRCQEFIEKHKEEKKTNVIYIGQFKGNGMCRHRSILFKVLCDIVEIKCRILRGWVNLNNKKYDHMWNQVQIKHEGFYVDCMNFLDFVPPEFSENYYNLGHSRKALENQLLTIDNLKRDYDEIRKETIGSGGFSLVYGLMFDVVDKTSKEGKVLSMKKCSLAVKEIRIQELNRRAHIKSEKYLKKEVEMMTMLSHPNVVEIVGCFSRKDKRKAYIVMKRYQYNGLQFILRLEEQEIGAGMSHTQKLIEVLILMMEVAKGLIYIHSFGVVHFDIKMENIMVNWDDEKEHVTEVRIADFGSSKGKGYHKLLTTMPSTTKDCTPPELKKLALLKDEDFANSEELSEKYFTVKSDVYTYGLLFSEFHRFYSGIEELENFVKKMLRDDPDERPEMEEVFDSILSIFRNLKLKYPKKSLSLHDLKRNRKTKEDVLKRIERKKKIGGSGRLHLMNRRSSFQMQHHKKQLKPSKEEEREGEEEIGEEYQPTTEKITIGGENEEVIPDSDESFGKRIESGSSENEEEDNISKGSRYSSSPVNHRSVSSVREKKKKKNYGYYKDGNKEMETVKREEETTREKIERKKRERLEQHQRGKEKKKKKKKKRYDQQSKIKGRGGRQQMKRNGKNRTRKGSGGGRRKPNPRLEGGRRSSGGGVKPKSEKEEKLRLIKEQMNKLVQIAKNESLKVSNQKNRKSKRKIKTKENGK